MANPQKENGYTSIANEILEALAKIRIAGEYRQVFDVILRKTYGFHKKEDVISLSQFVLASSLKKQSVCRAIRALVNMNLISEKDKGISKSYGIIKDFDGWKPLAKKITTKGSVNEKVNQRKRKSLESLTKKLHTKEKKETLTKETPIGGDIKSFLKGEEWNELIDLFEGVNPMYRSFYKLPYERKALDELAKTIGIEKLKKTIQALAQITSQPYAPKITKPSELKRDLGKLIQFYNQEKLKTKGKSNYIL